MKSMVRLVALALVVLASFTTLASAAKQEPDPCASFCSIVFCEGSQICGPTATGCRCHD